MDAAVHQASMLRSTSSALTGAPYRAEVEEVLRLGVPTATTYIGGRPYPSRIPVLHGRLGVLEFPFVVENGRAGVDTRRYRVLTPAEIVPRRILGPEGELVQIGERTIRPEDIERLVLDLTRNHGIAHSLATWTLAQPIAYDGTEGHE